MFVLIGTVTFCGWLPVKPLDRTIPPVEFVDVPLDQVYSTMRFEHKVPLSTYALAEDTRARTVTFETTEWMSKRDVANKFAREQNLIFREGYCGNGATVLWGMYPAFCQLEEIDKHHVRSSLSSKD